MDKKFWFSIQKNDYAPPEGHTVASLTEDLFAQIGSTDPELRDTIGQDVFGNWLEQGRYSLDELRDLIPRLLANLQNGLGKPDDDSVFLRSFSSLWLANILSHDLHRPLLEKEDVLAILEAALAYFPRELDLRGLVSEKGWAHAIAHGADVLEGAAHCPHTGAGDHLGILGCIANKIKATTHWVYLYGEDGRLARAVMTVFTRGTLGIEQVKTWLADLSADWEGAWQSEQRTCAFFTARNFLRAIRITLMEGEEIPQREILLKAVRETQEQAKPWLNTY